MMNEIRHSVGRSGGVNRREDVIVVQKLLNNHLAKLRPYGIHQQLVIDGLCGSKTIQAIEIYQKRIVDMAKPDGRVDPNGKTLQSLLQKVPRTTSSPPNFKGINTNYGFDDKASPPWLMVPESGEKRIILLNAGDLSVVSVDNSGNPALNIASVREASGVGSHAGQARRELVIKGHKKGTAFIELWEGLQKKAVRLEIAVKSRETVKIAFNFVEDNAGHKTTRTSASVNSWVNAMNNIYLPQTNIEIRKHSTQMVKINQNLGNIVLYSSLPRFC